jgi:hypothetical protein
MKAMRVAAVLMDGLDDGNVMHTLCEDNNQWSYVNPCMNKKLFYPGEMQSSD